MNENIQATSSRFNKRKATAFGLAALLVAGATLAALTQNNSFKAFLGYQAAGELSEATVYANGNLLPGDAPVNLFNGVIGTGTDSDAPFVLSSKGETTANTINLTAKVENTENRVMAETTRKSAVDVFGPLGIEVKAYLDGLAIEDSAAAVSEIDAYLQNFLVSLELGRLEGSPANTAATCLLHKATLASLIGANPVTGCTGSNPTVLDVEKVSVVLDDVDTIPVNSVVRTTIAPTGSIVPGVHIAALFGTDIALDGLNIQFTEQKNDFLRASEGFTNYTVASNLANFTHSSANIFVSSNSGGLNFRGSGASAQASRYSVVVYDRLGREIGYRVDSGTESRDVLQAANYLNTTVKNINSSTSLTEGYVRIEKTFMTEAAANLILKNNDTSLSLTSGVNPAGNIFFLQVQPDGATGFEVVNVWY